MLFLQIIPSVSRRTLCHPFSLGQKREEETERCYISHVAQGLLLDFRWSPIYGYLIWNDYELWARRGRVMKEDKNVDGNKFAMSNGRGRIWQVAVDESIKGAHSTWSSVLSLLLNRWIRSMKGTHSRLSLNRSIWVFVLCSDLVIPTIEKVVSIMLLWWIKPST